MRSVLHDPQATSQLARFVVEAGLVTEQAMVEVVRGLAPGERLAEVLVLRGLVAADKLAQTLSYHMGLPWVSLRHVNFSQRLVQMMPADVAGAFGVVPIYIRRPMDEAVAPTLFVATDDPTNPETMRACARACGVAVRVMVATAPDVTIALAREFGIGQVPDDIWDEPSDEVGVATGDAVAAGRVPTADLDAIEVVDIDEFEAGRAVAGQVVLRRAGGEDLAPYVVVGTRKRDFLRRCRVAARRFAVRIVQALDEQQGVAFRERRPLVVFVDQDAYESSPLAWSSLAVELGCPLSVLGRDFDGARAGSFIGLVLSKYKSRHG